MARAVRSRLDQLLLINDNCIDLIYLDPPFNKNRIFSSPIGGGRAQASFEDMWTWDKVNGEYLEQLYDGWPALARFMGSVGEIHGKPMMAYSVFMAQRIMELHRILKPTGALYLHCDQTAVHYLKVILDRVFGQANFRDQLIWKRATSTQKGSQHASKSWGNNVDVLLYYSKSEDTKITPLEPLTVEERVKKFNKLDEKNRRYYDDSAPIFSTPNMGARPNLCYEWRGIRNPHPSGWRLSKERLEEEYQKGNIVIKPNGKLERRKYERDYKGKPVGNLWDDIKPASGKEHTSYPTQKPLKLLKRIIKASTQPKDVVLDPFCGCATTMVAAQQTGRKWVGIDIEAKAAELVVERLSDDNKPLFEDFVRLVDPPERTDIEKVNIQKPSVKEKLYKEQAKLCNGCFLQFHIKNLEIDHILPRAKGGQTTENNLQLLCGHCNKRKGVNNMNYLRAKLKARETKLEALTYGVGD